MRRLAGAMVFVIGVACAEPPCPRALISRNGDPVVDGGSLVAEYFPFGVDGFPVTGEVFAPLSTCSGDRLHASAEYIDADGVAIPFEITLPQPKENGAVSVGVTLPAHQAGAVRFLKVTFEPALGERTTKVEFVSVATPRPGVEVPVAGLSTCEQVTAMTANDVACRRGDQLSISSADGGVAQFVGKAPVAAGTAVWSVNDQGRVERRELRDGGLVLTSTYPTTTTTPVFLATSRPTMHSPEWAIRVDTGGELNVVNKSGTALNFEVCPGCTWLAAVIADGRRAGFIPGGECVRVTRFAQCHDDLVAAEERWRWLAVEGGTIIETNSFSMQTPATSHRPIPFEVPATEFSIIPPWFAAGAEGYRALGTLRVDGGVGRVEIAAWKFGEVVSIADSFVVLRKSENAVTVVER
ncbi:MAG: hypothetical protein JNM17_34570 [Archangium sp.]|nr:hypothetical protein [Archangium sp.]